MTHTRRKFLQAAGLGTGTLASALTVGGGAAWSQEKKSTDKPKPRATREQPATPQSFHAQAKNFAESIPYRAAQPPGFTSWVALWKAPDASLLLSFSERRRGPNPVHRPVPLDFWESMSLPIKYQSQLCTSPDIIPETVVLQSTDQAKTWQEVGRSIHIMQPLAYASLPDGSLIRAVDNAYDAYYADERVRCIVERSTDLGKTWTQLGVVSDDLTTYVGSYRLLVMRDGAVGLLGCYTHTFGPGRFMPSRNMTPENVREQYQAVMYYSHDRGANWDGPVPLLPGVLASEPDWVELPSGDLLVVNSNVQGGANTRQIVRRSGKRFVPNFVMNITSGPVPENFVITKEGLLVGSRRGGVYACSKDLGNTWYPIGNIPNAWYQPRMVQLDDGRFCNCFHLGSDNVVGELDQYVGQHVFALDERLPSPTTLSIRRDRNPERTQYINAYTATLRAGDKPLAGKEVKFIVRASTRNRRSYKTEEFLRRTDANGQAGLSLPEFETCLDIHRDYTVQAEFTPGEADPNLAAARSAKYMAYRMTSVAGKKHPYAFYVAGQRLFAVPEMLQRFPELESLVKKFGLRSSFTTAEVQKELKLTPDRWEALRQTLIQHRVLRAGEAGAYRWNEVELTEVAPVTIEDDFVS